MKALIISVGNLLRRAGQTLATAESCTGGLIAKSITDLPGASDYYLGGLVGYADQVKCDMLDVTPDVLAEHGAVSEAVARAMGLGCRSRFDSDWALATTGIAGPTGGTDEKPVGLVYVCLAGARAAPVHRYTFNGDRGTIRLRAAAAAMDCLRLALLAEAER